MFSYLYPKKIIFSSLHAQLYLPLRVVQGLFEQTLPEWKLVTTSGGRPVFISVNGVG